MSNEDAVGLPAELFPVIGWHAAFESGQHALELSVGDGVNDHATGLSTGHLDSQALNLVDRKVEIVHQLDSVFDIRAALGLERLQRRT